MKRLALLLLVGLVSCKSAKPPVMDVAMPLSLDKEHSSLSAVAIKNEKIPVTLKFKDLEGSLTLQPLKADLSASLETLETGDLARDANIKEHFFEILQNEAFKKAVFTLENLDLPGGLESLKKDETRELSGKGSLNLHGVRFEISGPLSVKRMGDNSYSASFKDAWTVDIKKASMLAELKKLNKVCPKPHRVGWQVNLTGTLAFGKP